MTPPATERSGPNEGLQADVSGVLRAVDFQIDGADMVLSGLRGET